MLNQRILLAYDGSEESIRALDYAAGLATALKAEIGVVSVVPIHAGRIGMDPWDDRKIHSDELMDARSRLLESGLTPTLYEPAGAVAEEIIRTATEAKYDHIVLGSRHANLAQRILQGSVSATVATHATVTITIVH